MTLDQTKVGQTVAVRQIKGQGPLRLRLLELGLLPGTTVTVAGAAPLGDPVELALRGSLLTLQKAHCALVEVTPAHRRDRP